MLHTILEHQRWADQRTLASLQPPADPPREALRLFAHVIGAETIWMDRIEAAPQSSAVWPEPDLEFLEGAIDRLYDRFVAAAQRPPDQIVAYTNSAGRHFESRVDDILTHVALHGAYHRGQVAHLLRSSGLTPQPTDYIAFVRGAPAATNT